MLKVGRIIETALYCADLPRAADFYRRVFGFGTLLESERLIALDVSGQSVLLLFLLGATDAPFETPGGTIPGHSGSGQTHFAFSIAADDFEPWQRHLEAEGIAIESVVRWPHGAKSMYFRDPDRHVAELITPGFWAIY